MPSIVHDVLCSSGQPLDRATRDFMEPRFGHDFSHVRVHTDSRAAQSAAAVDALAYTVGRDVVFGAGQYAPGTDNGRRLMAHELTHVAQQRNATASAVGGVSSPDNPAEREAALTSRFALSGSARAIDSVQERETRLHVQRQEVPVDLEVPTPAELARLRQQGVDLPRVSARTASPQGHSDFIDRRLEAVGFGIYLFGYHLYVSGLPLPVFLPDSYVELGLTNVSPINSSTYPNREAALADIPYGPRVAGEPTPFAYYRAVSGLIVPTIISPATAPQTVQTMLAARRELGRQVQHDLAVLALSLVGGMLLRGLFSRLARVGETEPLTQPRGSEGESRLAARATRSPTQIGRELGDEVRTLPRGRRAEIARRINNENLSQQDAVTATGEASRVAFGRIGGTVRLPNGDKLVPSVMPGDNQPIFVVRPNGQVFPARATISIADPPDLANPVRITNIEFE